jgi:hypothetical protein
MLNFIVISLLLLLVGIYLLKRKRSKRRGIEAQNSVKSKVETEKSSDKYEIDLRFGVIDSNTNINIKVSDISSVSPE